MGYNLARRCVCMQHGERTPQSAHEAKQERAAKARIEADRKRLSPREFKFRYAVIEPLTPGDIEKLGQQEKP
jgi:hypothetical protein